MMNSVNRMMFPGLATGLDTNQIIKDMMRVERIPLQRLQQQRQIMEWQRDDYREINRLLASFRQKVDNNYLQSHFQKRTVVSSDEAAISTSVIGRPSQEMYSVEVKKLAQAGKYASMTLEEFQVNDVTQPFSEAVDVWQGDFTFTIQKDDGSAETFAVTGEDSVASVVEKINGAVAQTGVTAEIVGKRIVLKSRQMGESSFTLTTELEEDGQSTASRNMDLNILGMPVNGTHTSKEGAEPRQAEIVVNGVTLYSDTNRFIYDGLQIDVKRSTADGQFVNLSIGQDVDAVFEQVKEFVHAYNELIEKVQEKLGERRYRDYPPLTDEQREQLSDTEIEKWEERARSGLIKNDPFVRGIMSELRMDFYSAVEGVGHLSEIGIAVGEPNEGYTRYQEGGKLYIDEAKLREAIANDLDLVMNLFTKSGVSSDEKTRYKETGIGKRLNETLHRATMELTKRAGSALSMTEIDGSLMGKRLAEMDTRIADMERRLLQVEDRYWRQFTALEKAMERLNQQNNWLMSQLGQM